MSLEDEIQQLPEKFRPLSMWGYFGYMILFSIPLVGLVALIVFSLSDANINRRNFARSYFCFLIIIVILIIVVTMLGGFALLMHPGASRV